MSLQSIGPDVERMLEIFRRRAIPEVEWPAHLRHKCSICKDKGVETYAPPDHDGHPFMRPCKHCDAGMRQAQEWIRSGVWKGLTPEKIASIKSVPCHHDGIEDSTKHPAPESVGAKA